VPGTLPSWGCEGGTGKNQERAFSSKKGGGRGCLRKEDELKRKTDLSGLKFFVKGDLIEKRGARPQSGKGGAVLVQ